MAGIAWVTGASSGIGEQLVRRLAADGWRVAASARRQAPLEQLVADCGAAVVPFPLDVTDPAAVTVAVLSIEQTLGPIDLAVLNAGDYQPMALDDFDPALFRRLIEVNYFGVVNALASLLPRMRARGSGELLLNASLSAYRGLPLAAPYGASKAALLNLAETMRLELEGSGVSVRVINPGFVRTALTDKNRFAMPFLVDPDEAARRIHQQLGGKGFEIAFPRRFAALMKLLRCLPYRWYFPLVRRLTGQAK